MKENVLSASALKKILPLALKHRLSGYRNELYSKKTYIKYRMRKKYLTMPRLSPDSKQWLTELNSKGFCKISKPNFLESAEYFKLDINSETLRLSKPGSLTHIPEAAANTAGINNYWCSMKDPHIRKVFLDREILAMIYNYAGGQLFYRESPIFADHNYNGSNLLKSNRKEWANLLHSDYHLQINVMLLLTDITPETTKTIYAAGSNSRNFLLQNGKIEYPKSENLIDRYNYPLEQLTGKKGDVIIMDTGGMHAAEIIKGGRRTTLIGILNSGFPFKGYHENLEDLKFENETENFVIDSINMGKKSNG